MSDTDKATSHGVNRWYKYVSLSLSAFIMSLTVTLIGAYHSLKGAEIVVLPPKQAILYRDGEGSSSVLSIMLPLDFINIADGYGDVLVAASVQTGTSAPVFAYQATAHAVFTDKSDEAKTRCDVSVRCIALPGLLITERSDALTDLPSGAARSTAFTFPLTPWNCTGSPDTCNRYATFDGAFETMRSSPLRITVTLSFHSDGRREIVCDIPSVNARYLRKIGWISASCKYARVVGEPFF